MCYKQCLHWLFFQALAQNSELRERLCKIHAESHIIEPTLINLTAHVQVGEGMQWLYSQPPPHHLHDDYYYLHLFFFILPSLEFATEWMSCPFLLILIQEMLPSFHPLTRLTWFHNDSDCKEINVFFSTTHSSGMLSPQIRSTSIPCYDKVLHLSLVIVYTHVLLSHGSGENHLPHYHLLKEALCSHSQICWPESVSWFS